MSEVRVYKFLLAQNIYFGGHVSTNSAFTTFMYQISSLT